MFLLVLFSNHKFAYSVTLPLLPISSSIKVLIAVISGSINNKIRKAISTALNYYRTTNKFHHCILYVILSRNKVGLLK